MASKEAEQPTEAQIREWAEGSLALVKLTEQNRPPGSSRREEPNWNLVEELLESFFRNQLDSQINENIISQLSLIYENHDQAERHAQMRGYFFEIFSRYTPLNNPLVVTMPPIEVLADNDKKLKFAHFLEGLDQQTVFELRRNARTEGDRVSWDKGAVISRLIQERLNKIIHETASEQERNEYVAYLPAVDKKSAFYRAKFEEGKTIIKFDLDKREWVEVCKDESKLGQHPEWLDAANQLNDKFARALTVPDAVIIDDGKPIGVIETKCYQNEELDALVEKIREQPTGPTPGGIVTGEDLNLALNLENKTPSYQGVERLDLLLRLAEEVMFMESSSGAVVDNPILVLRFPGNIPPDQLEDLQKELYQKGFHNLVIQQILLDADEIQAIATEFIESQEFIEVMETNMRQMETGEIRGINVNDKKQNIKARALALGVRLEDLVDWQAPNEINSPPSDINEEISNSKEHHLAKLKADAEKYRMI